ncbi:hypothetical protein TWF506_004053 [Arthrobotrys conoides]|uniref:Uncharacterized protein n=1 Tax=Arthrobotrys conoides TaxID=74498 RepID=A0AAN8N356_9PEZI
MNPGGSPLGGTRGHIVTLFSMLLLSATLIPSIHASIITYRVDTIGRYNTWFFEEYHIIRRTGEMVDILKRTRQTDCPIGGEFDGVSLPRDYGRSLTYIIDTLMHVLDSFDERLVILRNSYAALCPEQGLSFEVAVELANWECEVLEQVEDISNTLSELVSTVTRARDRMSNVGRKIDGLIGFESGGGNIDRIADLGLNLTTRQDKNLAALAYMINSGQVNYRQRTIKLDSEARKEVALSWRRVISQLVIEMQYAQDVLRYANDYLDTEEFNRIVQGWGNRGRASLGIPDVLEDLIKWYRCWIGPLGWVVDLVGNALADVPDPGVRWGIGGLLSP